MIPADVASRLRLVLPDQPAPPQPPPAAGKLADVLSEFVPGQRLMAEIQALLPNGVYRAVVAQRDITLALPFSAKPGDALELEVVDSDGKLTLAFVANRTAGEAQGKESVSTTLSRTGKLIGDLMGKIDDQGKRAPPAPLNANQPLIEDFPKDAAQLAPVLKEAISKSGMFYEAHQARWVEGKLPTAALLQEPQGKHSSPAAAASAAGPSLPAATAAGLPSAAPPAPGSPAYPLAPPSQAPYTQANSTADTPVVAPPLPASGAPAYAEMAQMPEALASMPPTDTAPEMTLATALSTGTPAPELPPAGQPPAEALPAPSEQIAERPQAPAISAKEAFSARTEAASDKAGPPAAQPTANAASAHPQPTADNPIAAELTPLVRQQLDALATQNFVWQGQVWPGQQMHWEIEEERGDRPPAEDAEPQQWLTRLKLTLPGLGGIDAVMRLVPGGALDIALVADQEPSRQTLAAAGEGLRRQLGDAGLQLTAFSVRHGEASG